MATTVASIFPGTFNARDLGGLRTAAGLTRSGVVFRSDVPTDLGEDGRALLGRIGLRTAIDLREPIERNHRPADFGNLPVTVVNQPVLGDLAVHADSTLEQVYWSLLETRGVELTAAVAAVAADGSTPAVIFCSAGKDRTGLVSALLLGAVGVADEEIIADYHLTERNVQGEFRARLERHALAAGLGQQQLAVKLGAPAELMRAVLEWLRSSYGGATGYLDEHGLGSDGLESLRRRLVVSGDG